MISYALLKWIHIVSATLMVGTGLGSAFYKWLADRSGNIDVIAVTNRHVVLADWLFTTPTVIIQPVSGYLLVQTLGYPLNTSWLLATFALYILAAGCWLPVVWLQIRMRDLAGTARDNAQPLGQNYHRYARTWFWLGVPAFASVLAIYALMIFKPYW